MLRIYRQRMSPINGAQNIKTEPSNQQLFNKKMFNCIDEIEQYKCKKCINFQSTYLTCLKQHIREGHGYKTPEMVIYKCLSCLFVTHSRYFFLCHRFFSKCGSRSGLYKKNQFVYYKDNELENNSHIHYELFHYSNEEKEELFAQMQTRNSSFAYSSSDQTFKCAQCVSKFKAKSTLEAHIISHHLNPDQTEWFKCEQCPHKYKLEQLKIHITMHHTKVEDIQWLHCVHCPSKFKSKYSFKRHITSHHTDSKDTQFLECEKCMSQFKRKTALNSYLHTCRKSKQTLNGKDVQLLLKCPHCSITFKAKSSLVRHVTYFHAKSENTEWFECEQCPYKSRRRADFKNHITTHMKAEDIQWYQCEHCISKFKTKRSMNGHINLYHANPEDVQFKCEHCPVKFTAKSSLERHIAYSHNIPEDLRQFCCPHCPSNFKYKQSLRRHVRAVHGSLEDFSEN